MYTCILYSKEPLVKPHSALGLQKAAQAVADVKFGTRLRILQKQLLGLQHEDFKIWSTIHLDFLRYIFRSLAPSHNCAHMAVTGYED